MKRTSPKRRISRPEVPAEEERTVRRLVTAITRELKEKGLRSFDELRQALLRAHYDVETARLAAEQYGRERVGATPGKLPLTAENAQWLAGQ